ncbi:MAG TPA: hypothetical protein PLO25_01675 [Candidatus Saccharibacteria bacterium]|nr:hypothetical protein [Candidatus Saccharibacteria bacterium]
MFLVGILSWWYGDGFSRRIQLIKERLISSIDFFSIDILLSSFFAPFRQISAGNVSGPIGDQIRAFFDKLLSRIVGAIVRSFVIFFGLIVIFLQLIFSLLTIIVWLILPTFPVIGLILTAVGGVSL